MNEALDVVVRLAVASLAGIGVGMEREWSGHASGPEGRFGGIRTFFLYGLTAGIAGWLAATGMTAPATVLLAAQAAFAVAAWVVAVRRHPEDLDATTEIAALAVLALGVLAGLGRLDLAAGATAVVVLALSEKGRIHGFVRRIGEPTLRAGLQFAVLALVILPLLPTGPYGPYDAIRPRALWTLVLVFSGLNFAGYLARRGIGEDRGYALTGAMGGLVSSTGVTAVFSRRSRDEPEAGRALALGVVAACTILSARIAVITAILDPRVTLHLAPALVLPALVGGVIAFREFRRTSAAARDHGELSGSPLNLVSAIRLAILLQAAFLAVEVVGDRVGGTAILGLAALLGLTDTDALTVSMTTRPEVAGGVAAAATAIGVGIVSNGLMKLGLVLGLGRGEFRRLASLGLLLLLVATGVGVLLIGVV
jgi:uncharacterized membrane protein (DUF4010 family)